MYKKSKIIIYACVISLFITLGVLTPFITKADMVEIESGEDIDLTYMSINGHYNSDVWDCTGSLSSDATAQYILTSNGWSQWYKDDNMSFAYKAVDFNYSNMAQVTSETTMTSFDGVAENSGAGIMVRSGLEPDSACVVMIVHPGSIAVNYRSEDGVNTTQGETVSTTTSGLYPISFKIVLVKGQSNAVCYYKTGDNEYIEYATVPFTYDSEIYTGICSYSQNQEFLATSKFSTFSYKVEAPEGYTVQNPASLGEVLPSEPEEIVLPEDLPVAENVLMRETFTDGSMVNNNGENQNNVTNPIWVGSTDNADIQNDAEQTERWLYENMQTESHYLAGDRTWTDYKTSFELEFTDEYSMNEACEFYAFVRATDIAQYGYEYYYVCLKKENSNSQNVVMVIGDSPANNYLSVSNGYARVIQTIPLNMTLEELIGQHNLTIMSFDNKITVYFDYEMITEYTDNTEYIKPTGCVGFGSNGAAVKVDNILVTKMDDLLGGDYDNRICGNWNEPEPEYLERFKELEAAY